MHHKRLTMRSN